MHPPNTPATTTTFLFPVVDSPTIPSPSPFFSPHLLSSPLPTNSFFQNFALNPTPQPEYIHPYLVKPYPSPPSLSLCYPSRICSPSSLTQSFRPDLTISTFGTPSHGPHIISSFHDLSITLDIPPSLRFFLVRGSPYVTCSTDLPVEISLSSIHAFLHVSSNASGTRHRFDFNSGQSFLCYSSSPISLLLMDDKKTQLKSAAPFSGVLRFVALLDAAHETILDRFSSCYPVSGDATFVRPYQLEYRWEEEGSGELLLLAHPLHIRLLSPTVHVVKEFRCNSIDGELVGVVGNSWTLETNPIPITWNSIAGVRKSDHKEIISALHADVKNLTSTRIHTTSLYPYGKVIARAARLALIAEEVGFLDVIPMVKKFLEDTITPWLDGSFKGNSFMYDPKWRGIVTRRGVSDRLAEDGFGIYSNHHNYLGYFIYAIAVLSKLDNEWGRRYKPYAYALLSDIMTLSWNPNSSYARLRCFDLWKLHSWAGGLTEFPDGRHQENTGEAVNAYYAAALMGSIYGDSQLVDVASTMASMEVRAAKTWWHVREGGMYGEDFSRENRVVGVLWANKRDSGLWFASTERRECRLGIQVLPLLPVTEVLFEDEGFVRELVAWAEVTLGREGVGEGWKGFVYAMQGVYDREGALRKVRDLKGFDDGNSLTNLLWWLHGRGMVSPNGRDSQFSSAESQAMLGGHTEGGVVTVEDPSRRIGAGGRTRWRLWCCC